MRIVDAHEIRINANERIILISVQLANEFGFRSYSLKYIKRNIEDYSLETIELVDSFELLDKIQRGANLSKIAITESDEDTLRRLHISEEDFVRVARMADETTSYDGDTNYEDYLEKIRNKKR